MKMLGFVHDAHGAGPYTGRRDSGDVKLAARRRASLGSDYEEGTSLFLTEEQ
jgi:hypothetical protein